MVQLKPLINFWRTLEMPLINYEINLILTWSSTCVINNSKGARKIEITDTKIYVSVVTLLIQDNAKLIQQLKPGFKRTISWKKYQSKASTEAQNQYLDSLINLFFQGVNKLFVLSLENENGGSSHSEYYLPKVEIQEYNVKIDGKNFFNQPVNNDIKKYKTLYLI